MKILFVAISISLVLFISLCHSGDVERTRNSEIILGFPQAIPINSYQSLGFSCINFAPASELASSNPAILSDYSDFRVGVQFEYFTKIDDAVFNGIGIERSYPWIPSSFGAFYSIKDFHFGLAFNKKYSYKLDIGEIPITTIEDPYGTSGETFSPKYKSTLNSFSGLFSYSIISKESNNKSLSIGLQLFVDYLYSKEEIPNYFTKMSDYSFSWKIGVKYSPNNLFDLGLLFEKGISISGSIDYNISNQIIAFPDTSTRVNYLSRFSLPEKFHAKSPNKLAVGISTYPLKNLSFSATATYIFWHSLNSQINDQIELSMSGIYNFTSYLNISTGIHVTDLRSEVSRIIGGYDATYLQAGLQFPFSYGNIQFIIMDSHLISNERRKNTIYNFGIDYKFNKI